MSCAFLYKGSCEENQILHKLKWSLPPTCMTGNEGTNMKLKICNRSVKTYVTGDVLQ